VSTSLRAGDINITEETMPASTSNVLNEARSLVERRLRELDQERTRLERALSDLTGGRVGRRRPGRPRGAGAGRGRRRRGGTRADQAVKIVGSNPGITASEIAKRMRIKPNYLYRVMGDLQKEGRVRKRGRGYHPTK
jgi:sugar-specific transcriptional regulator TrmB